MLRTVRTTLHEVFMATKRGTMRRQVARGRSVGGPIPGAVIEAIETERGRLMKAESLLGCLTTAMESDDHCDAHSRACMPHYPDVARMACDLIRQSIDQLDSVTLERRAGAKAVREEFRSWGECKDILATRASSALGLPNLMESPCVMELPYSMR